MKRDEAGVDLDVIAIAHRPRDDVAMRVIGFASSAVMSPWRSCHEMSV